MFKHGHYKISTWLVQWVRNQQGIWAYSLHKNLCLLQQLTRIILLTEKSARKDFSRMPENISIVLIFQGLRLFWLIKKQKARQKIYYDKKIIIWPAKTEIKITNHCDNAHQETAVNMNSFIFTLCFYCLLTTVKVIDKLFVDFFRIFFAISELN